MMASLTLRVKVKPNAKVSLLEQQSDGSWLARLKAPPVDDKANAELIALVAQHFGCRKAAVRITGGVTARLKRLTVDLPE